MTDKFSPVYHRSSDKMNSCYSDGNGEVCCSENGDRKRKNCDFGYEEKESVDVRQVSGRFHIEYGLSIDTDDITEISVSCVSRKTVNGQESTGSLFARNNSNRSSDSYYGTSSQNPEHNDIVNANHRLFREGSTGSAKTSVDAVKDTSGVVFNAKTSVDAVKDTSGVVLPPCRVCGAKASGFHYGVNTCEACKGFFRRALKRPATFCCARNRKCDVKGNKRSTCRFCRYKLCLSLGMSRESIKTGRYSHKKRTRDTIEVKRLLSSPNSITDSSELDSIVRSLFTAHDSAIPSFSCTPQELIYRRQLECHETYLLQKKISAYTGINSTAAGSSFVHGFRTPSSEKSNYESSDRVKLSSSSPSSSQLSSDSGFIDDQDDDGCHQPGLSERYGTVDVRATASVLKENCDKETNSISGSSNTEVSNVQKVRQHELACIYSESAECRVSRSEFHVYNSRHENNHMGLTGSSSIDDPSEPRQHGARRSSCAICPFHEEHYAIQYKPETLCPSNNLEITGNYGKFMSGVFHPHSENSLSMEFNATLTEVGHNLAQYENSIARHASSEVHQYSSEESRNASCRNVYLPMPCSCSKVSDTGPSPTPLEMISVNDILKSKDLETLGSEIPASGAEVAASARSVMKLPGTRDFGEVTKSLEMGEEPDSESVRRATKWIEGYVKFARTIPGFTSLPPEDQSTLLKHAWDEVWLLGAYRGYNSDLGVVVTPCGKCFHVDELQKVWGKNYSDIAFRVADIIKGQNLSTELITLLRTVCIASPDRCALKNSDMVCEIHWTTVSCLLRHIEVAHPTEHLMFPRLVSILTSLRDLSESARRVMGNGRDDDLAECRNILFESFAPF